jgi:ATP-dependent DNA ligase
MTRAARADDQAAGSARTRQPAWLDPELATLTADRFSDPAWIFERKFDGERCLVFRDGQQLRLMTRNRQRVTGTYPEIAGALRVQDATDFIIDGEVVAFDGDPKGSRVGFGALLLGYYGRDGRLHYAGKVGTGFDRHTLTSLHAALAADQRPDPPFEPVRALPRSGVHWVQPRVVAQIGFSEWTADGELRQPRFQGLRRDKDPANVVRETPLRDQPLGRVLDGNNGERPSQPAAQLLGLTSPPGATRSGAMRSVIKRRRLSIP